MVSLRRSELSRLLDPDAFVWATGIEDTFIAHPWPENGRILDEYALCCHYEHWREDIDLVAHLGVGAARYGIPWYRVNPAPGQWDWTWADGPLEYLLERGVAPIVDLVHYGTPDWIEGSFLHPDYPRYVAEYAYHVAERFRGRIHAYTPLNEPRVNAWFCGKIGWWPPYRHGWKGFLDVLLPICRGIVETAAALHAADPEIALFHVDATDIYEAGDPSVEEAAREAQEIVFLALDLVTGRVTEDHPLFGWLRRKRIPLSALAWFRECRVPIDVMGINLYPMFSFKRLVRSGGRVRTRLPYASGEIVDRLGRMYWERYGAPVMITETAAGGTVSRRKTWLADSVAGVRRLRSKGVPLVGYTWWPLFSLIGWEYRQRQTRLAEHLIHMGLWDLDPDTMARQSTPVAEAYRAIVSKGPDEVGRLSITDYRASTTG